MGHEPNLAVLEKDVRNLEKWFDKMQELQTSNERLIRDQILLNKQFLDRFTHIETEMDEVKKTTQELQTIRNQATGGFSTVKTILTFLAGAITVLATVWAMIPRAH